MPVLVLVFSATLLDFTAFRYLFTTLFLKVLVSDVEFFEVVFLEKIRLLPLTEV